MKTTICGRLDRMEELAAGWTARHGVTLLRISLGLVFFWFGALKFFPGLSPAEDLAARTIGVLTLGVVGPSVSLPVLAAWECAIGLSFITGRGVRAGILLLLAQMAGTFLPLVFFPAEVWTHVPYAATLEGQYIIKNVVLVSAGVVLWATARGHALVQRDTTVTSPRLGLPAPEQRVRSLQVGSAHRRVLPVGAVSLARAQQSRRPGHWVAACRGEE